MIDSLCALHSLEHSERITELYKEEKEEGNREDQEEKIGSQKERDKSRQ